LHFAFKLSRRIFKQNAAAHRCQAIFKILGAIGAGLFVVLYFIVDAIDPDDAPTFIAGTVVCLIAAGALAVLYLIVAVLYRLFVPRPRRTNADIERGTYCFCSRGLIYKSGRAVLPTPGRP
jgi:hypothetical protein